MIYYKLLPQIESCELALTRSSRQILTINYETSFNKIKKTNTKKASKFSHPYSKDNTLNSRPTFDANSGYTFPSRQQLASHVNNCNLLKNMLTLLGLGVFHPSRRVLEHTSETTKDFFFKLCDFSTKYIETKIRKTKFLLLPWQPHF